MFCWPCIPVQSRK